SWCGELLPEETTVAELLRGRGYATFRASHDFHRGFSTNLLGLGQGFAEEQLEPEESRSDGMVLDQRISANAQKFIESHKGERWFGWVFFASPHLPYYNRYRDMPAGNDAERYLHELRYMDAQFGAIIAALDRHHELDRTIVIFTADHGEELGDHG